MAKAMNLSVVGSGYVGLVTAVGLAMNGNHVTCIDCDPGKVRQINEGISPFYEAGLSELLASCLKLGHSLKAVEDYDEIAGSEVVFVCVGTFSELERKTDFTQIIAAASEIGRVLRKANGYHLIVIKSTVVPGTTEEIIIPTLESHSSKRAGKDFGVAVNPEFLQEGKAMDCFISPGRIVIGEYDRRSGDWLEELYREFRCPIIRTNPRTAEMIKYASNAFLATKISFINEIGNLCKNLEIDVYEVAKGMGYDPRIGNQFLNAGLGFGGSCLPKDLEALISRARKLGYRAKLLEAASKLNREQPFRLVQMAKDRLRGLENRVIAVLGLAFKPDTDDVREAPALKIIARLLTEGAVVRAYDPKAMPNAKQVLPDIIKFCDSAPDTIAGADCVLITTEWDEFKDERLYAGKLVIDGKRTLDPKKARAICHYEGICW